MVAVVDFQELLNHQIKFGVEVVEVVEGQEA
jgi:hypothetical protein